MLYNADMKKVLIIDDEENIQASLGSVLQDEGFQVFFATNGDEGIEKYKNIRPDAVFLDVWLPQKDGLEVMKQILDAHPFQIIIMISGHSSISAAVSAVKAGAYDFLEKPLSLDKVILVLKRALEYQSVLEENTKLKLILSAEKQLTANDDKRKVVRENSAHLEFPLGADQQLRRQKTVRQSHTFYGIGLHSGVKTGMVINPLSAGKGIRFENIAEEGYVPARIEYLDSTGYATSIRKDTLEARTIEHLLATLHAFSITNLAIKINREVPIDDGSAINFCELIRESGIVEQEESIPEIVIKERLLIGEENENGKFICIEPADVFTVKYTCVYPEPLGRQSYEFVMHGPEDFEREIAPARTYGFVDEINKLVEMGLADGGRINNFILIDQARIINTTLRFPEELARHKILDIIGDFYLLGRPIRGRIIAQGTGHSDNARMVNAIKDKFIAP